MKLPDDPKDPKVVPIRDPDTVGANEDAIATAFVDDHCGQLKFCNVWGTWMIWDGHRWVKERKRMALHYARGIARRANKSGAKGTAKASTAAGAERFAQADPRMSTVPEDWDSDDWLLSTEGGTIDLITGRIRPSDPNDLITKSTAVGPSGDCPIFMGFLWESTGGNAELMDYLQRVAGYCLTGSVKEHALFFVYGDGGNGKGTFINTLTAILADYARVTPMDTFTASKNERHLTEIAYLQGARLATSQETEQDKHWAEVKIKSMTGGDPLSARFMRQDLFTFMPTFKLLIAGNHKPSLNTVDEAVRRRFHIIPFTNVPESKDLDLSDKLRTEWPGILQWMIEGCLNWQRIGLQPPPIVVDATNEYFDEQNTFAQWVDECCTTGRLAEDTSAKLYESWKKFCDHNGEPAGTSKALAQQLIRAGFVKARVRRAKGFSGISVNVVDTSRQWQNQHEADV